MLIEPSGSIRIKCVGDQIHADSQFQAWGLSVPQSSVEPEQLNEACFKVARACKARGVVGFFTVDFITFIHPKTVCVQCAMSRAIQRLRKHYIDLPTQMRQELWAIDLGISYSDSLAMFNLFEFATQGKLDAMTHYFDVPPPKKEEKKVRRRKCVRTRARTHQHSLWLLHSHVVLQTKGRG